MHHSRQHNITTKYLLRIGSGLGINADRTSTLLLFPLAPAGSIQFMIYSRMARRWGVLSVLRFCMTAMPIIFVLTPYHAIIGTQALQQVAMMFLIRGKRAIGVCTFLSIFVLMTKDCHPGLKALAILSGYNLVVVAVGRGPGPSLVGWLETVGVASGYISMPWWITDELWIVGTFLVFPTVDMRGIPKFNSNTQEQS